MSNLYERLAFAKQAFIDMQKDFEGKEKVITISAVARKCGIDRKYFYGAINTPDEKLKQAWADFGREIKSFKVSTREAIEVNVSLSLKDKLKASLVENYDLVESNINLTREKFRLEKILTETRLANEKLLFQIRQLEVIKKLDGHSVRQFSIKPVVISPDALQKGADPLSRKQSWVMAVNRLREFLARPLEKDLFITVGVPGCGKSTWSSSFAGNGRPTAIFDACNLTRADRYELLALAHSESNVRTIAVVFHVSLSTVIARNSSRSRSKKVSNDLVQVMYESLEYPAFSDDVEVFDEIWNLRC